MFLWLFYGSEVSILFLRGRIGKEFCASLELWFEKGNGFFCVYNQFFSAFMDKRALLVVVIRF